MSQTATKVSSSLSTYDIFGYLAPGGALLLGVYLFELWIARIVQHDAAGRSSIHVPFTTALSLIAEAVPDGSWLAATLAGLAVLGAAYVVGHITASVASFGIDRVYVYKGFGYPYETLLGLVTDKSWRPVSQAFYRGLFGWMNVYIALRILAVIMWRQYSNGIFVPADIVGAWIVAAVILKIAVSTQRASWSQHDLFKKAPYSKMCGWGEWVIVRLWAGPFALVLKMLSGPINTRRSFSTDFTTAYMREFTSTFGLKGSDADTNHYWLCMSYVLERSQRLGQVLSAWRNLYGFARNLSCALFLVSIYTLVWLTIYRGHFPQWDRASVDVLVWLPAIVYILAFLMLFRFYYLYVAYYSKYVFRAFMTLRSRSAATPLLQDMNSGGCALG